MLQLEIIKDILLKVIMSNYSSNISIVIVCGLLYDMLCSKLTVIMIVKKI